MAWNGFASLAEIWGGDLWEKSFEAGDDANSSAGVN